MQMKTANIGFALIVFAISAFLYITSFSFPKSIRAGLPGPDFWPQIILIGIMGLCIALVITNLRIKISTAKVIWNMKEVYIIIILTAVYLLSMNIIGFLVSTLLFFPAVLLYLGVRKWYMLTLFPLIFVGCIYIGFEVLLGLSLF